MIARALEKQHLKQILKSLEGKTLTARRNTALVMMAMSTGIRVGELVSLDLDQVLEDPRSKKNRIRSISALRKDQIKRHKEAGIFVIPEKTRAALRAYIRSAQKAKLLKLPAKRHAPLFVVIHGCTAKKAKPGDRLSKRSAQRMFHDLQLTIGIVPVYRFHDLRHTFQSKLAESGAHPYTIAAAARLQNVSTTVRYVHTRTDEIRRAVEEAF